MVIFFLGQSLTFLLAGFFYTDDCDNMDLATVEEVKGNLNLVKSMIHEKWVFIRLANGASISGSGYGWTIREEDTRELGLKLCYAKNDIPSNKDKNECLQTPDICQYKCTNTLGSFKCTCPTGYTSNNNQCHGMFIR